MNINENMEAMSSSTSAIKKSRGDWLAPKKSASYIRTALNLFVALSFSALITSVIVLSLKLSEMKKNERFYGLDSVRYNSFVANPMYSPYFADHEHTMDPSTYEYGIGLEKVAQRVCELNPESRNELGRGTWTFLHILAAAYPIHPTPQTIQDHKLFFQLLPRIYPCPDCRSHMAKMFQELPPRLENREDFIQWICEAHNKVNERLGKPTFDCSKHDERWDCGCGIVPGQPLGAGSNPQPVGNEPNTQESKTRDSKSRKSVKKDAQSRKSQHLHKKHLKNV